MEKVLFFDVEYANAKNKSICQLGLLSEFFPSGEPVFPERSIYINPEDGFQDWCIKVHGITEKKVENEKKFPEVWNEVKQYFSDTVIVGYNVFIADLVALAKSCARYNIELPKLYYIDVMRIVTDFIPYTFVRDFTLESVCEYFEIDIDKSHDAFNDACATADLFKCLIETFNVDINKYIKVFNPLDAYDFVEYVADPVLRRTMCEFYGIVQGFSLDAKITKEEENFIKEWKVDNEKLRNNKDLSELFLKLDKILADGTVSIDEMLELRTVIGKYYITIVGSAITNSLEELRGLLKGIITDNKVLTEEGINLLKWMYGNIYLYDHYPFNKILSLFEGVLSDGVITEEESKILIDIINSILNPVDMLESQLFSILDKNVCLSGNFEHGKKSDIEKIIVKNGGKIDSGLKKTTDILVIGEYKSQAYAHGDYGTKVRKAMEFNEKGSNILILKESDFFEKYN